MKDCATDFEIDLFESQLQVSEGIVIHSRDSVLRFTFRRQCLFDLMSAVSGNDAHFQQSSCVHRELETLQSGE